MVEIYVIKSTYEKNADDGIEYFTDKQELAYAVHGAEERGGTVQVFKCVPVKHESYIERVGIVFYEMGPWKEAANEIEQLREALADIANIVNPYEDGDTMQEIARAALKGIPDGYR